MDGKNILILGGTGDAISIAEQLSLIENYKIITSLAGVTQKPRLPIGKVHIGGFGGREGLVNFLEANKINLIVDATHPFSTQIKENAIFASNELSVPIIHFVRDQWKMEIGDKWHMVDNLPEASNKLRELSSTRKLKVFLTVGRKGLADFADILNSKFVIRSIEKPSALERFSCAEWIEGRGPFSFDNELKLLQQEQIDIIVTKNSGGLSGKAKLLAARTLGLPVIVVRQPPRPLGAKCNTIEGVVELSLKKVGEA